MSHSLTSSHSLTPPLPPSVSVLLNQATATVVTVFLFHSVVDKPQLHQLECLKVGGRQLRVVQEVAAKWEELAVHLEFSGSVIKIIKADHRYCEASCREMFHRWLAGEVTWKGLAEALRDMERGNLAEHVEQALSS